MLTRKTIAASIVDRYGRDRERAVVTVETLRKSRRFGFPLVVQSPGKSDAEYLVDAARFLISISSTWTDFDFLAVDDDFAAELLGILLQGGPLHDDAKALVADAQANSAQLKVRSV